MLIREKKIISNNIKSMIHKSKPDPQVFSGVFFF